MVGPTWKRSHYHKRNSAFNRGFDVLNFSLRSLVDLLDGFIGALVALYGYQMGPIHGAEYGEMLG